jgi:hypothetical protein
MVNRCVECALGEVASCAGADAGSRCLLDKGLCGCFTNDDCSPERFCRQIACIARPQAHPAEAGAPDADVHAGPSAVGGCSAGARDASFPPGAGLVLVALALRRRRFRDTRCSSFGSGRRT